MAGYELDVPCPKRFQWDRFEGRWMPRIWSFSKKEADYGPAPTPDVRCDHCKLCSRRSRSAAAVSFAASSAARRAARSSCRASLLGSSPRIKAQSSRHAIEVGGSAGSVVDDRDAARALKEVRAPQFSVVRAGRAAELCRIRPVPLGRGARRDQPRYQRVPGLPPKPGSPLPSTTRWPRRGRSCPTVRSK